MSQHGDDPEWVSMRNKSKGPRAQGDRHNWKEVDKTDSDKTDESDKAASMSAESDSNQYECGSCNYSDHIRNLDQNYIGTPICPDCGGEMD